MPTAAAVAIAATTAKIQAMDAQQQVTGLVRAIIGFSYRCFSYSFFRVNFFPFFFFFFIWF